MKTFAPKLLIAVSLLSTVYIFSGCVKNNPEPPPPGDSTQVADLKKGLLLYLPFTGNFADSSGNNNPTSALAGANLSTDQNGNSASSFDASGNGGRVVVTNNGSIHFDTAYSVSMNVMLRSFQRSGFLNMVNHSQGNGWVFGLGTDVGNTNIFNFNTVDTTGDCSTTVQPYNDQLVKSQSALQPYTWYNIITVFHKGISQIFINGQLVSTLTSSNMHVPVCMSSSIDVGFWWDGDLSNVNGKLDEIRIYNRPINAAEIAKLSAGFPVQQQPTQPVADLKRGLLLYLPFNGSIADSSGNNNLTQFVGGAALTNDEHGYANSAFGDDGTGGRLIVTNNGSIKFDTAFSVSMSFMERNNSARQTLLSMINTATGKGVTFGFGNAQPTTREMVFGVVSNLASCDDFAVPSNTTNDTSHNFIPQPDSWYNIVCTYHSGTLETYINGVLTGRQAGVSTSARICPDSKLVVGGWWDGDPTSINGKIDNVRLYNRVLLPEEIAMLSQHFQPTTNSVRQAVSH